MENKELREYEDEICSKAILKWGTDLQKIVLMEECAELIQAISKSLRITENSTANRDNIVEEIADVYIMLHQIRAVYGIDDLLLNAVKYSKLKKLHHILE